MTTNKNTITSIAIGGFDGMHMAHQTLFSNLTPNGAIVVIDAGYANLTPKTHRQDHTKYPVYYYDLASIKHLKGKEFIELLHQEFPKLQKIVVGFDFCFGKNRTHCIKELKEIFEGDVVVIKEVIVNNIPVHSRIIREYIKKGDITTANNLLGKEYTIHGTQIKGQGLGSKSFVPTINLQVNDFLLPNEGVYATKTIINNQAFQSVTFLGHRVTTDGSYAVETHILNEKITNQMEDIQIEFFKKTRDNQKFESFEALKDQIDLDITYVNQYFNKE